jgi:putative transposase
VKIVVQVRLFPDAAQQAALRATLDLCNQAANTASTLAYERRVFAKQSLQRLTYSQLKGMGLSAQPAIHVARKVAGGVCHSEGQHPGGKPRPGRLETAAVRRG